MLVLRFLDDEGNVVQETDYDESEWCAGSRSGATSELCGGCSRCIEMQLAHYGTPYEIVDDTK